MDINNQMNKDFNIYTDMDMDKNCNSTDMDRDINWDIGIDFAMDMDSVRYPYSLGMDINMVY